MTVNSVFQIPSPVLAEGVQAGQGSFDWKGSVKWPETLFPSNVLQ